MVQQLPDRRALGDRAGDAVELERALLDELEHERGHEGLRDAGDAEAVLLRQRLAGLHVGDPARSFPARAGPGGDRDDARQAVGDRGVQRGVESHRVTSLSGTGQGGGMATLDEKARRFLEEPFVGEVTTLRPNGSPHTTVVWVDVDTDVVMFNTAVGRAKERYLRNDPRVSLIVVDPENTYRWVSVDGTAELTTDGADAQIDKLAKKYLGEDEYPWRNPAETRISVRIRPKHVDSYGFDE